MFDKISFSGFKVGLNNFSFGMLFSVIFHGTIFFATIFALPFVVKKPLELMPIVSVELIQISEKTNIPYAPKAAKIIEMDKISCEYFAEITFNYIEETLADLDITVVSVEVSEHESNSAGFYRN